MKVLFTAHNDFLKLAKELSGKHEIFSVDQNFSRSLGDMDIKNTHISASFNDSMRQQSMTIAANLIKLLLEHDYDQYDLDDFTKGFVKSSIVPFMYPKLPDFVSFIGMLDITKPDVAVIHNAVDPVCKTVALWCETNAVPCLHVPHSVYIDVGRGAVGTDIHDVIRESDVVVAGWQSQKIH